MKRIVRKSHIVFVALTLLFLLCACGSDPQPSTSAKGTVHTTSPSEATTAASDTTAGTADTSATTETDTTVAETDTAKTEAASDVITTTTDTPVTEPTEAVTEPRTVDLTVTLATYNIKHGADGLDKIAEAIREISPDIIGLEEVDVNCERSGNVDEPAELARLAGYPYYVFSRAISLGDGEYGTAILSRYPIESFEIISLESGNGEDRTVGHAVVSVDGLKTDVFVTHLSYQSSSLRITQMETIAGLLAGCEHYVVLGDFNSFDLEDIFHLGADYYVNRPERSYITFRRREMAIDNIVVSKSFTELTSGVSDREGSDHKLLYAAFQLTGTCE